MHLLYISSLVVIFLKSVACAKKPSCEPGEYHIDGICCPMCDSGNRVQRPCTATTSGATSCIPCMAGTYMDHPSGLPECFKCKTCDRGSWLRVKRTCTYTRNTVCSCMDGHFCLNPVTEDCDLCERHKVCVPGEKVTFPGTERTNTVCEKCPTGTFSNQSMSNFCITWTSCLDMGRKEKQRGTHLKDAECSEPIRLRTGLKAAVGVVITVLTGIVFFILISECIEKGNEKVEFRGTTLKLPVEERDCNTTVSEPLVQHNNHLPIEETKDPSDAEMDREPDTPSTSELPQSTTTTSGDPVLQLTFVSAVEIQLQ